MKRRISIPLSFIHRNIMFGPGDTIVTNLRPLFGCEAALRVNWTRWDDIEISEPSDFQVRLDRAGIDDAILYLIENDGLNLDKPHHYYQDHP